VYGLEEEQWVEFNAHLLLYEGLLDWKCLRIDSLGDLLGNGRIQKEDKVIETTITFSDQGASSQCERSCFMIKSCADYIPSLGTSDLLRATDILYHPSLTNAAGQ